MSEPLGIYIHIPFCMRKCSYCDFYSAAPSDGDIEAYSRALIRRINAYPEGLAADTVYFGGGTPSLLSPDHLGEIISACRRRFSLADNSEISMEANPASVSADMLSRYIGAGINRISIGVQSLIDDELESLGRLHNAAVAERFVLAAYEAGFREISCDMMLGIPKQTRTSAAETLGRLCALPITHISAYMLKIEENTPFAAWRETLPLPCEDELCDIYLDTVGYLEKKDFHQYEISNFAREGSECRHNLKYWHCDEYIGIGASAHSFFGGVRYAAHRDTAGFIAGRDIEYVTDADGGTREEKIMLGLRLSEGIERSLVPENICLALAAQGLAALEGDRVRLTPQGFLVSNQIIAALL